MIDIATRLLIDELGQFIEDTTSITANDVVIENIANWENDPNNNLTDKIVATLVNVEEESTMKNRRPTQVNLNGGIDYVSPPIHLNLYLLFSAVPDGVAQAYEIALKRISQVICFFQAKRMFTVKNSPFSTISTASSLSDLEKNEIRLQVELYTMTFEQINHLWGSLGGKQVPSVMYKIRLVEVKHRIAQEAPVIEEIQNNINTTKS